MRELRFAYAKIKGADQLCGNRTWDQKFKALAIFCGFTAGFVVNIPEDRFSYDAAQENLTVTDSTAAS